MADRKPPARLIVWAMSDLHCGYRFGLMRPGIRLPAMDEREDFFKPRPTAFQTLIWRHYLSDIAFVRRLAGRDPMHLLIMGDVVQGSNILRDGMLVTPRDSDQKHILEDALVPVLSMPNLRRVRITKGTAPHSGRHGSAELGLAKHIRDAYKKDAKAYYHMKLSIAGVSFDIAHHGPSTGIWPWVEGDQMRRYARALMFRELQAGRRPPRVILRGHYHDRTWETLRVRAGEQTVSTDIVVCPGYSLFTDDYTLKQTKSKDYMTVGSMVFELIQTQGEPIVHVHDRAHLVHVAKTEKLQ